MIDFDSTNEINRMEILSGKDLWVHGGYSGLNLLALVQICLEAPESKIQVFGATSSEWTDTAKKVHAV